MAAAPDRSALCDFFDSQRGLAPPGRVRGPRAAREGSGALGYVLLRSSYSLEASGTRCAWRAGGLIDAYTIALSGVNSRPKSTTNLADIKAALRDPRRRRCGRRPQHRRGAGGRRPARRGGGPFEARNADHAAPFVRLGARRFKKTAQRDRVPAQRSISPCTRAAQVAEPDAVHEKVLQRRHVGVGPRVAPTARGTAQYTARVPRHNSSEATSSTPSPPPPARRPPVPRHTTATQEQ